MKPPFTGWIFYGDFDWWFSMVGLSWDYHGIIIGYIYDSHETSIDSGFSMAMLNDQMVSWWWNHSWSWWVLYFSISWFSGILLYHDADGIMECGKKMKGKRYIWNEFIGILSRENVEFTCKHVCGIIRAKLQNNQEKWWRWLFLLVIFRFSWESFDLR